MFERFTDRACGVIVRAERDASTLGHGHVGTEHLLLGVVHDGACVGGRAFSSLGVSYDDARAAVAARVPAAIGADNGQVAFTARAKELLELSVRVALQQAHTRIGTGDLTLALLRMRDSTALRVLDDLGVDRTIADVRVLEMISASARERPAQRGGVATREFELSPQAQELLRRALRIGASYVAQRYAPAKLVSGASTTSRLMRELGTGPGLERPDERPSPTRDARDRTNSSRHASSIECLSNTSRTTSGLVSGSMCSGKAHKHGRLARDRAARVEALPGCVWRLKKTP